MKKLLALVLGVAAVSPLAADYTLDFNTAGQFAGEFGSAQPGPITQSGSGGLNGSGSLDLSGMTGGSTAQQIVTFNQAFAGNLSSWSASIYYYGNAQHFWQFGVLTTATPALNDGWAHDGSSYVPSIWLESGNADGGSFGVGSYDGVGETIYDVSIVDGGLPASAEWYKYTINVMHTGGSNFTIAGTMNQANADGSLGAVLATALLLIENAAIAADSTVYLYLNLYDGVAIDNFYTTTYTPAVIPEPATLAALAGLLALGFVSWRRRAARA
ncbi:MAG: PEP-CTERM sorting domain-containing protein [Candidatus Didemnitutus sp.]|nr:PEP-CTERM sorting domain-containing protein [Candidatus Didemnitutus sp.]